jgi:hypothetical protein
MCPSPFDRLMVSDHIRDFLPSRVSDEWGEPGTEDFSAAC